MILGNEWRGIPIFERAKPHIRSAGVLLDVGPGVRPQSFVDCEYPICIEPHFEYCAELVRAGFRVLHGTAPRSVRLLAGVGIPVDTVVMLDVIEHMARDDGLEAIRSACDIAREQVIVFTPLGFMPQDGGEEADAWGMQGQHWQRHRSGWTPEDFPGWLHFVDEHFAPGHAAFLAIWSRQ